MKYINIDKETDAFYIKNPHLFCFFRSNISLSCHSSCGSVDDGLQGSHPQYQDTILTIEELRAQLNSCFT